MLARPVRPDKGVGMTAVSQPTPDAFDPAAKEQQLAAESSSWDTSVVVDAVEGDIPIVDVASYFASGSRDDLDAAAATMQYALEEVGFYQLTGHGVTQVNDILEATRLFHALPLGVKQTILIDQPDATLGSVGYMPVGARKLPSRGKGNPNEAFLLKADRGVTFDDNEWLPEDVLPGFRSSVEAYATAMTGLALRLLPLYAVALDLAPDFFASAFEHPFSRLRMTHYPHAPEGDDLGDVGIPPHVDTTFMTLLLPDSPGLVIYSQLREEWIRVPVVTGALVVNAGELLRQWSNDRVLSTRHFANNTSAQSRYSVPFFFNATADHPMECLPSCCGPQNPAKYPTISYQQSQGVVQGE